MEGTHALLGEFEVAGLVYRTDRNRVESIKSGDKLTLVREPKNTHDPEAIAVYHQIASSEPTHIGYIPRDFNRAIAALMDFGDLMVLDGYEVVARVSEVNPRQGLVVLKVYLCRS